MLPTSIERNRKRPQSSMDEINVFYNAMLPRLKEILAYLDQFSLQEMPQDALRLMFLSLSLAEVSPSRWNCSTSQKSPAAAIRRDS